eukprot:5500940-Ditylum_brightwellii.AAC.1
MQGSYYHSMYGCVSGEDNDAHPNTHVDGGYMQGNSGCGEAAPAAVWFGESEMQSGDYHSMFKG